MEGRKKNRRQKERIEDWKTEGREKKREFRRWNSEEKKENDIAKTEDGSKRSLSFFSFFYFFARYAVTKSRVSVSH